MVRIDQPFWLGRHEITNAQYARFDPAHDSRFIDQQHKDHTTPGYPANQPDQPVIRVSFEQARAFCDWLGGASGVVCDLPTEAQWEYACRAGSSTPFHFGDLEADFSPYANLADINMKKFAVQGVNPQPIPQPGILDDFLPKIEAINDGNMLPAPVGRYQPNAWGLYDMHGNVSEWARPDTSARRAVARGGSWRDRPHRATAFYGLDYAGWQPVFNVGFRVCVLEDGKQLQAAVNP